MGIRSLTFNEWKQQGIPDKPILIKEWHWKKIQYVFDFTNLVRSEFSSVLKFLRKILFS